MKTCDETEWLKLRKQKSRLRKQQSMIFAFWAWKSGEYSLTCFAYCQGFQVIPASQFIRRRFFLKKEEKKKKLSLIIQRYVTWTGNRTFIGIWSLVFRFAMTFVVFCFFKVLNLLHPSGKLYFKVVIRYVIARLRYQTDATIRQKFCGLIRRIDDKAPAWKQQQQKKTKKQQQHLCMLSEKGTVHFRDIS